jgi:hypothetical protein
MKMEPTNNNDFTASLKNHTKSFTQSVQIAHRVLEVSYRKCYNT